MTEPAKEEAIQVLAGVLKTYPELLNRVYDDAVSGVAKEVGQVAVGAVSEVGGLALDLAKSARLITAPIQYMAHLQIKLSKYLRRVESEIPVERQVTPPPPLLLPVLEKLKYQTDDDLLTRLYVELLKRACDKQRADEAHPAFVNIISQLSSDEALIIFHLAGNGRNHGKYFLSEKKGAQNRMLNHLQVSKVPQPASAPSGFTTRSSAVAKNLFPLEDLAQPAYLDMYLSHLKSLNLIQLRTSPGVVNLHMTEDDRVSNRLVKRDLVWFDMTLFGELFARACIPPDMNLSNALG